MSPLFATLLFPTLLTTLNGQLLPESVGGELRRGLPGLEPVDLPFVPEEYNRRRLRRPPGQRLMEFTNDTVRVEGMRAMVKDALNRYVANMSQTFSELEYHYAGLMEGEGASPGVTTFVVKVSAKVCYDHLAKSYASQRSSPPSPPDRCIKQNCELELDAASADGEISPSLTVTGHSCRPVGNLCFSCGAPWEEKCPDIDDLKADKGLLPRPTLCLQGDDGDAQEEASLSVPCFAQFTEVAAQRSFVRMGCGEPVERDDDEDEDEDEEERTKECKTDSAAYRQYCSCWSPLCNGAFLRDSLSSSTAAAASNEELMKAIRQLKAHVDSALDQRCTGS